MTTHPRRSRRWHSARAVVGGVAIVGLVAATLTTSALSATAAPRSAPVDIADKIRPKLAQQLEDKGRATFWIRFDARADLGAASSLAGWDARGEAVYDALKKTATGSQKGVISRLRSAGVDYQAFYATNAIRVNAGSEQLAREIAGRPEVQALYPTRDYQLPKPIKGKNVRGPDAVEWGIANINADDVWAQYDVRGEGITVANIDSGVQFDHPALVEQYRGNNGDGTFTHDYNFFDAAEACGATPCDTDGHGTHVMGTMAGDDGAANQIGVAPGANWIAANGCCPSDAALIASGEWMLAPTDTEGENPDPSRRPNIINNSWGTVSPSNDPFMEDIQLAWEAAGIFGSWSNGNSGPSCETSGSPGSRIINYSVGAYDVNNNIAGFSARGVGQDGEIKPNISAPGVNVRSSFPGDDYGSISGTSMASPHVAGTVALLWSAAPALVGDVEGTRELLNEAALDTEDLQCGGTADDNNVYGEGRLDALALLDIAPIGESGTLAGTVTDADTGDPVAGATVEIVGEADRTLRSRSDGTYSARLPTGDYTVTVSKFGYAEQSTEATVETDQTTTVDFALVTSPTVTMSGYVTDGGSYGWPLYATLAIEGADQTFYTEPDTGYFEFAIPSNATYSVTVESQYPGYVPLTQEVTIGDSDAVEEFALEVDTSTCTAPGYVFNVDGETENFNSGTLPDGWSIEDNVGNDQVWQFDDPGGRGNLTGGDGGFAIVDSDFYGPDNTQDTSLVSPVVDMSDLTSPVVGFKQDYNNLGDTADVDVSIDGGATWENVLSQTTDAPGPREDVLQLPMAAGEPEVQVRFHYYEAEYAWWWEVDDVFVGNRTCDPIGGGLVVGNVYDANTDEGVNAASVTSLDRPVEAAKTAATPDDPGLDDGFYWMFSSLTGTHPFEAKANQYSTEEKPVRVRVNNASRADFVLDAGLLSVAPGAVRSRMQLGNGTRTRVVEVTNNGGLPVDIEVGERKGDFVMLRADGTRASRDAILAADGAPLNRIEGRFSPLSLAAAGGGAASGAPAAAQPTDDPWTDLADYPEDTMDAGATTVDGLLYSFGGTSGGDIVSSAYVYDPATTAWSAIEAMPDGRENPAVAAVDGLIYITGGWLPDGEPATSTLVYDPGTDTYTAAAEQPVGVAAPGRAVLDGQIYLVGGCQFDCGLTDVQVYDPAGDSWSQAADYPEDTSHVACGAIDGQLYCAGGTAVGTSTSTFVYDPGADSWSPMADLPIDLWGMAYTAANGMLLVSGGVTNEFSTITNEGFAYDPGADSWTPLPNANITSYRPGSACGLYRIGGSDSPGFNPISAVELLPGMDDCGEAGADVEWLSADPTTLTVDPGETAEVRITMDSDVAQPGTYTAGVTMKENTPYAVEPVGVTMTITPPASWGKLAGQVTGVACDGSTAPIPGATVQVDSWSTDWTFSTDVDGRYAYWMDVRNNPLALIAAKDGYKPQAKSARLIRGQTVTVNFALQKARC